MFGILELDFLYMT